MQKSGLPEYGSLYIDGTSIGGDVRHSYAAFSDGFWVQALCEKCNQRRAGARSAALTQTSPRRSPTLPG